jgi:hypothetical protein
MPSGTWDCPVPQEIYFELVGEITEIETFAIRGSIQDLALLRKQYGPGRWRKRKGKAMVRLRSGRIRQAEVHWYEAHGIGKRKLKIKRFLDGHV